MSSASTSMAVVAGSVVFPGLTQGSSTTSGGLLIRLDRRSAFDPAALFFDLQHAGDNVCTLNADCASNHCQNGYCCASGDCCGMDSDCDAYDLAPTCNDDSGCQGTRTEGVCDGLSQCEIVLLDDDSGCMGLEADSCAEFSSVYCSSASQQTAPSCSSSCGNDSDCDAAYHCSAGECLLDLAQGSACVGSSQCVSGFSCVDGVCCDGSVDNGSFEDSFESNGSCGNFTSLAVVRSSGPTSMIAYNTMTVYGAGDDDDDRITAEESDSSCSCCDFFCLDEDYQLRITLTVPNGAGAYQLCTGVACGGVNNSCVTVSAGQQRALTWTMDGGCGPNDNYERWVRIYGTSAPAYSCAPYELTYQFVPGCS